MIITVTLNPALDKKLTADTLAPGATNKCVLERTDISGKGINVSKAVAAIGGASVATGFMGGRHAAAFTDYLDAFNIPHDFTYISGEVRTNIKLTERNNNRETEINEDGFAVTPADINAFSENLKKYYDKDNIICVSGSLPKGAAASIYNEIILSAKKQGARVIFDSSGDALKAGIEAVPFAIKPNLYEFETYFNERINNLNEIKQRAKRLINGGTAYIIVSMGGEGACFFTKDAAVRAYITEKIPVMGTIGAGDCMCAALAVCLQENKNFYDTARLCMASAAASVMEIGTVPGRLENIERLKGAVKIEDIKGGL